MHRETIRQHETFRVALQAMSRPGCVFQLPPEDGLMPVESILGCLVDNEVVVACIGSGSEELLNRICTDHGCRRGHLSEADFVLITEGNAHGALTGLRRGTSDYPERGATAIYLIDEIRSTGGADILRGPGIKGTASPLFNGLAAGELTRLGEVNQEYPLGIDVMLVDRCGRVSCLPRSTRIGES